jgi:hypothetical protein
MDGMKAYRGGADSGVAAYASAPGWIAIRFHHGGTYLYDATRPGQRDVLAMQALAEAGEGLNTYINQHVRDRYAARLD